MLDTPAARPFAIYAATLLTGGVVAGVIVGKVAADAIFYTVAIIGYERRRGRR